MVVEKHQLKPKKKNIHSIEQYGKTIFIQACRTEVQYGSKIQLDHVFV